MCSDMDLEAPWVGKCREDYRKIEPRKVFTCEWCGESVYEGELSYNFDGERVCEDCVNSCRETAMVGD